jgi:hypothetical protein
VYVKFRSTKMISLGDTLYCQDGSACLKVANKSSISCISNALVGKTVAVGDSLTAWVIDPNAAAVPVPIKPKDLVRTPDTEPDTAGVVVVINPQKVQNPARVERVAKPRYARPRMSAASYNNFAAVQPTSTWRLTWQLNGALKSHKRISVDQYVVYRRSYDAQDTFLNRFGNAFKVYSLAAQYDFGRGTTLSVGRKINQRFSSVGALDGLQFERALGRFVQAGALLGSRPRLTDYAIDLNLMQAGVWVGFGGDRAIRTDSIGNPKRPNSQASATLGLMEQRNGVAVDRRFLYGQTTYHIQKWALFGSTEVDFYQNVRDTVKTEPQLTNVYLQARYRFSQRMDASLAYDARRNIIFYESYKLFIDQLIDNETRQGIRMAWNYRPTRKWWVGAHGSTRFQSGGGNEVRNGNLFVTCNQIPRLKTSATVTGGWLQTAYLQNQSYSARLTRPFWKGKWQAEANYRYLTYDYTNDAANTVQHVYGINVSAVLSKKLSLFFFAEQTTDVRSMDFTRIQTKVMYRP